MEPLSRVVPTHVHIDANFVAAEYYGAGGFVRIARSGDDLVVSVHSGIDKTSISSMLNSHEIVFSGAIIEHVYGAGGSIGLVIEEGRARLRAMFDQWHIAELSASAREPVSI